MAPPEAAAPARVLLVDDHAIVRRGLRSILELEPDISVVAEAGGWNDALQALDHSRPDVIVLDLKLSSEHDTEGLDLCSEIVRRRPQSNVVILSTFLNERLLDQSLRRGAKAYVLKEVDVVELVKIIRRVSQGESGFDGRSAAMVRSLVAGEHAPADVGFTEREREVTELVASGLTNARDRAPHLRQREHREVPRAQRDAQARRPQPRRGRLRRRQAGPARSRAALGWSGLRSGRRSR